MKFPSKLNLEVEVILHLDRSTQHHAKSVTSSRVSVRTLSITATLAVFHVL